MNHNAVREMLKRNEGRSLKPYTDTVGKLTIGYGRNLTDEGITEEEALFMLDNDIVDHWGDLVEALPWVTKLDEPRQHVMLDMAFNMGIDRLLKFRNTIAAVKERRFADAARGIRASLYCRQVKSRCTRNAAIMEVG